MADVAHVSVVVLWEPELRAAALALRDVYEALRGKDTAKAELSVKSALESCYSALHVMADHPEAHVVVCSGDRMRFVPRVTNVNPPAPPAQPTNPQAARPQKVSES